MAIPNDSTAANPALLRGVYEELPLDASRREIRVLDLKAATIKDAPLQGTLRVVSLAESPDFTALSYVWGAPWATRQYHIEANNGWTIDLTRDCFQALKNLRAKCGNLTIWVDALCINQVNVAEKSAQIPLMGEIYTWARRVYIWLGEGSVDSDAAIDWFWENSHEKHALAGLPLVAEATGSGIRELITVSLKLARTILVSQLCCAADQMWGVTLGRLVAHAALQCPRRSSMWLDAEVWALELLSHPWFERAWTFQELVLAWDPVFLCGEKQLSWDALVRAAECLRLRRCGSVRIMRWNRASSASYARDIAVMEKLNRIQGLLSVWMDLPRPTRWNGERKRNPIQDTEDAVSALEYQRLLRTKRPFYWWFHLIYITCRMVNIFFLSFWSMALPLTILAAHSLLAGETERDITIFLQVQIAVLFLLAFILLLLFDTNTKPLFHDRWLPSSRVPSLTSQAARGMATVPYQGLSLSMASSISAHVTQSPTGTRAQRKKPSSALNGIIYALRRRRATEPADKAHALRGIMASLGYSHIRADYSLDKNEVYSQLLGDLLRWSPESIVLIMDAGSPTAGQPSWVPSWDQLPKRAWVDDTYFQIIEESTLPPEHPQATRRAVAFAQVDGRKLTVRGHVFDRVKWTSREIRLVSEADFWEASPSGSNLLLELLQYLLRNISLSREGTFDHFLAGMYMVSWNEIYDQTSEGVLSFYWLFKMRASRLVGSSPESAEEAAAALYRELRARHETRHVLIEICHNIGKKEDVFFTENGLVGISAPVVKAGHGIFLICGLPLPMILQRVDKAGTGNGPYQVVCASFVDGVMDGTYFKEELVEELVLV